MGSWGYIPACTDKPRMKTLPSALSTNERALLSPDWVEVLLEDFFSGRVDILVLVNKRKQYDKQTHTEKPIIQYYEVFAE